MLVGRVAFGALARGALIWGGVFALTVLSSVFAYKSTYGTPAERAELLRGITSNSGIRALFGPAREIDTVGGFLAWRTLSLIPMVAGIWGLLVATRVLRGEEDRGRWETLVSAPLTRGGATLATLAGIGAGFLVLLVPTAIAILAAAAVPGDIGVAGGLWLALALCIAAPAYAAVGALTSQLAATRREAAALAGGVFAATFLVKVAADGADDPLPRAWEDRGVPTPLVIIESPYRETVRPILRYVRHLRREHPGDVVSIIIPEYVVGHWWQNVLHNQTALRLKSRLRFEPSVTVTSVPWVLGSRAPARPPAGRSVSQ